MTSASRAAFLFVTVVPRFFAVSLGSATIYNLCVPLQKIVTPLRGFL